MLADIVNWLQQFVPLAQMDTVVTACTPTFQLIAVLLLVLGAVQEIPKHQAEGVFLVIARVVVICAFIAYVPSWMFFGEVFAQNLTSVICSAASQSVGGTGAMTAFISSGNQPSLANTPILSNTPGSLASNSQGALVMYDYTTLYSQLDSTLTAVSNGYTAVSQNNEPEWKKIVGIVVGGLPGVAINAGEDLIVDAFNYIFNFCSNLLAAISVFVLATMLLIQKAILILSRLFMPPFLALLSWQGPSRFLGVNYLQSVIAVMSWPIGWGIVYIGGVAGLANVQTILAQGIKTGSLGGNPVTPISLFVDIALICLWLMTGAIIAPMLMTRVVTAGGNFAAGLVGAAAGRALGLGGAMVSAAAGAAGTAAGAAIGAAVGGPAGAVTGASMGSSIGGGLGNAVAGQTFGSAQSAVGQATGGDGGGGGAVPSRASSYAGMAALQGISQMNQPPPPA